MERLNRRMNTSRRLVVALEDDLLFVPAEAGEAFADRGDHVVETADVGVDVEGGRLGGEHFFYGHGGVCNGVYNGCGAGSGVAAGFDDVAEILLDVATVADPLFAGTAECGDVVEVLVLGGYPIEVVAVVNLALVAGAVDEPDLFALAAVQDWVEAGVFALFREEPLGETSHGSDAGSGGYEDGVGEWGTKDEVAMRPVDLDCVPFGQVDEVIGEETAFDAVDAEVKAIAVGGRGDRVGPGLRFASGIGSYSRDELAGGEGKVRQLVDLKFEVVALGYFGDTGFFFEAGGVGLTRQNGFSLEKR